ncbi:MAG: membrane protein [Sulfurovum sp. PC08-66]|nr:MAG: membrane protein [Sulfurovum sp. PC08-66]
MLEYLYLFGSAFISATLFPLGSEVLFVYYVKENFDIVLLLWVATLGNVLGSVVNYYFGHKGEEYLETQKILSQAQRVKYQKYFDRYGGYALLLAWVPIVGDPITLVAGVLRYNFIYFAILVTISKLLRYLFLAYFVI